jgi:serine/threonine protein phosphatase PrpC
MDLDDDHSGRCLRLRLSVLSVRNARARNEDAVGIGGWVMQGDEVSLGLDLALSWPSPPLRVAVADGMGGKPGGHLAARIGAAVLSTGPPDDTGPRPRLVVPFERADAQVRAAATADTRGLGCTAALLELDAEGNARIGNVGDVRVYRVVEGYPGQLTRDDRPAQAGAEATGQVTQCVGGLHPRFLDPHQYDLAVEVGDRLLLTTDGVHDAVDVAAVAGQSQSDARTYVEAARSAGARDNLTAVVIHILDVRAGSDRDGPKQPGSTVRPALT